MSILNLMVTSMSTLNSHQILRLKTAQNVISYMYHQISVCLFSFDLSQEKGFKVEQDLNRGRVLAVFSSLIGKRALELRSTDPRLDQSVKPNVVFDTQKFLRPLNQSERSVLQWVCTSSHLIEHISCLQC